MYRLACNCLSKETGRHRYGATLYKNLHPDPVSGNRGRLLRTPPTQPRRVGGGRRPAAHAAAAPASVRGKALWVTHTHQAGRRRWRGAARGDKRAGRGAWRQSHHRRLPRFCSDAVPHRLAMLPVATVPVGAALKTPAASNLRASTRPMAHLPRGERKDVLDTVA